jgi:hypothetical protein
MVLMIFTNNLKFVNYQNIIQWAWQIRVGTYNNSDVSGFL